VGDVTASIFVRQSHTGFRYYDYELGRSWKSLSSAKSSPAEFLQSTKNLVAAIARPRPGCAKHDIADSDVICPYPTPRPTYTRLAAGFYAAASRLTGSNGLTILRLIRIQVTGTLAKPQPCASR